MMSLFIALNVEEGISVPELELSFPAQRNGGGLAVADQELACGILDIIGAGLSMKPWQTRRPRPSLRVFISV